MSEVLADDCTIEHLVKALHQQKKPGPATWKTISNALPKSIRPDKTSLVRLLQEGVQSGRLWEFFPKGEDEPYYWTESPAQLARRKILAKLSTKDQSESELRKTLGVAEFKSIDADALLAELVNEGTVFRRLSGRTVKYSTRPIDVQAVTQAAWEKVQQKLSAKDATESELKKAVTPILQGVLEPEEFLQGLLADEKIFRGAKSGKTVRYSLKPVDFRSFAKHFEQPVADFVAKLCKLAEKLGVPENIALELAQEQFRQQTGFETPEASAKPQAVSAAGSPFSDPVDRPLKDLILEAMRALNPRVADGDLVLIPELRQRLGQSAVDKTSFDRAMVELYRSRRVVLSKISDAMIAETDRAGYVVDGDGVYYNTAALWKE